MRYYLLLLLSIPVLCNAQNIRVTPNEIVSIADVIQKFETTSTVRFSYDVQVMEETYIQPNKAILELSSFLSIIEKEAAVSNQVSGSETYRLIKEVETLEYCIQLLDKWSQFPIMGATLNTRDKASYTDEAGNAQLKVSAGAKVTISYNGKDVNYLFKRKINDECVTFYFEDDITFLNEVVIENYLTKGLVQRTNGSIELKPSDLGILPGLVEPDIFQSLQLVPGISSPNENAAALNIRGGTPYQNIVLWDGIKMYQTGHFFNQISAFNPYIIDNASIYKGGTSVRYGDRLSGVIDISSTDDVFEEEFGVGLNLTTLDFYLKNPITDKLGIMIAGRRSITDIIKSFTFSRLEDKVFQNTEEIIDIDQTEDLTNPFKTSFSDYNIKLVWKPTEFQMLKLSAILVVDEFDNNKINSSIEEPAVRDGTDRIVQSNFGTSLTYTDHTPGKSVKKAQAYISSYFTDYTLRSTDTNENDEDEQLFLERYDYILDVGYDTSIKVPTGNNNHLLFGQQSSYKRITNTVGEGLFDFDNTFQVTASFIPSVLDVVGYGEYSYSKNKTKFIAGLRAGYYNNFETPFIEPRLFGSYKISNTTRITASLERKNQSISQLYAPQREPRLFQLVPLINLYWSEQRFDNEEVRILRSDQSTLGINYNYNGWTLEAEGYLKKITGLSPLTSDLLTQILVLQQRNDVPQGESTRYGFDLLIKKKWNNYRIWAGLSVAENSTIFTDFQNNSFTPPIDQQVRINLSQTYTFKTLELGLGWTYGSGLSTTPLTTGSTQNIQSLLTNNLLYSDRIDSYHRLDFSIFNNFKKIGNWRGKLGFAIRNAYARKRPLQPFNTLYNLDETTAVRNNTTNSLGLTADIVLRATWN